MENKFGKFKDAIALYEAYLSLEKEFTKRSQRVQELQALVEPKIVGCDSVIVKPISGKWTYKLGCGHLVNEITTYCPHCGSKIELGKKFTPQFMGMDLANSEVNHE